MNDYLLFKKSCYFYSYYQYTINSLYTLLSSAFKMAAVGAGEGFVSGGGDEGGEGDASGEAGGWLFDEGTSSILRLQNGHDLLSTSHLSTQSR